LRLGAEVVGTGHALSDLELTSSYEHDYTGRYDAPARMMVGPATTLATATVKAATSPRAMPHPQLISSGSPIAYAASSRPSSKRDMTTPKNTSTSRSTRQSRGRPSNCVRAGAQRREAALP